MNIDSMEGLHKKLDEMEDGQKLELRFSDRGPAFVMSKKVAERLSKLLGMEVIEPQGMREQVARVVIVDPEVDAKAIEGILKRASEILKGDPTLNVPTRAMAKGRHEVDFVLEAPPQIDMSDMRSRIEPKPKWNDAPAWTPGGGAPRRRGRK